MLTFVTGRKSSGKTKYIMTEIEKLAKSNESVILIVPEQFSFEAEKQILFEFGAPLANKIQVFSFTRLCENIISEFGGLCSEIVDDGTRYILLMQALNSVKDELKIYGKYYNSREFCTSIMRTVYEFKQAGISSKVLTEFVSKTDSNELKLKIHDINLILCAYNALLETKFLDPLDILEKAKELIMGKNWFDEKYVFFDFFDGFTQVQFNLIENIIAESKSCYFTLCTDKLSSQKSDFSIFSNIQVTANRLTNIAKNHSVEISKVVLKDNYYNSVDLSALEAHLSGNPTNSNTIDFKNIKICKADNVQNELNFVYEEICRLVREDNYRYRDIVIIARNKDKYLQTVKTTADKFSVPTFINDSVSLSSLPLSRFILNAFEATSLSSDSIFKFLKTGLSSLTKDEIFILENYVYIWNINGKEWTIPWDKGINGIEKTNQAEINKINEIRFKAIYPILNFNKSLQNNSESISKAIINLLKECKTIEKLKTLASNLEEMGKFTEAENQRQGYAEFMRVIDKIVAIFGNADISHKEYLSYLKAELDFVSIGEIPQTVDQVLFGIADKIKPANPKIVFILGANLGDFPSTALESGLFSPFECNKLSSISPIFSENIINTLTDERFLFYSSVCCAKDKTYITYNTSVSETASGEVCDEIASLIERFQSLEVITYFDETKLTVNNIQSKKSAFEKAIKNMNDSDELIASLISYFGNDELYLEKLEKAKNIFSSNKDRLSLDTARGLYTKHDELWFSASKIEEFSKCRFRFFCRYGLGLQPLKKAEIDPATRGTIVHYILENFVLKHKETIGKLDDDYIEKSINKYIARYFEEIGIDFNSLDTKILYTLKIIRETSINLLKKIRNEFAQSEFVIDKCELQIGGEDVEPLKVNINYGFKMCITGKIDRVDRCEDGNTRIVDYKTGKKVFKISDILYGLNIQMLLYLYALIKNNSSNQKNIEPAGVLYFPARIDDNEDSKFMKMNGLLIKDKAVLDRMEKNLNGKIIPVSLKSNADFTATSSVATKEQFFKIFEHIDRTLKKIGNELLDGSVAPNPLVDSDKKVCEYCDFNSICKIDSDTPCTVCENRKKDEVFEILEKGSDN